MEAVFGIRPRRCLKKVAVVAVTVLFGLFVVGTQLTECEVKRTEAWRGERSRQVQTCADQCSGPFQVHFENGTKTIRCECSQND